MGWLQMSKQELRRVEVLTAVLAGQRTTESAAGVLGVSLRQAQRLVARYRDSGGGGLIHRAAADRQATSCPQAFVSWFSNSSGRTTGTSGPTLAAEVLLNRHAVDVSRETLRKWMVEASVWLSRKQRRSFHQVPETRARRSRKSKCTGGQGPMDVCRSSPIQQERRS